MDDFIRDELILDKKEDYDEVLITIDNSNRVSRIAAKYYVEPTIPEQRIHMYESEIKWLRWGLTRPSTDPNHVTESEARSRISRYKHIIELIKSVEAASCGDTSGSSNQP